MIHSKQELSNIDKFHYLLLSTSGPAKAIVASFPLLDQNYSAAFAALVERYQNRRLLANTYLEKLLKFNLSTSDQSLPYLQGYYFILHDNVTSLMHLTIPDLADYILLYLSLQRLDKETRTAFELLHTKTEFPRTDHLITFIRKRCQALEISDMPSTSKVIKFNQRHKSHALMTTSPKETNLAPQVAFNKCKLCMKPHKISSCPEFLKLSPRERRDVVKKYTMCFNCLETSHMLNNCKSTFKCRTCHRTHHSLLHANQDYERSETPVEQTHMSSNVISETPSHPPQSFARITTTTVLLGTALAQVRDSTEPL